MFIRNNHTSFHLCWKEKLAKYQKVLKYYKNFISTPFYFFDVSPVEKLLSGLTPHTFSPQWVKQSLPPWYWDRVLLYHFSNVWIETYLSECQYILRLCAFPLSILNLLVNQCIGEFCLCNGSQQWELRDYKNLERSVQANILWNITSLGKFSF